MTDKEMLELEAMAKAAMEQHPEETREILERAVLDRKQEMWSSIRRKAHRQMIARKARPWAAAAAVLVAAIILTGVIGVNQARAGKEGLLVDIVENVAGDIQVTLTRNPIESVEPKNFEPMDIANGTWEQIQESVDARIQGLLPGALPAIYVFEQGIYQQPSYDMIILHLIYKDTEHNDYLVIQYTYNGPDSALSNNIIMDSDPPVDKKEWDGMSVYIIRDEGQNNLVWEQDHILISAMGQMDDEQMREVFNSIAREP